MLALPKLYIYNTLFYSHTVGVLRKKVPSKTLTCSWSYGHPHLSLPKATNNLKDLDGLFS